MTSWLASIGVPLIPWRILVALWHAKELIAIAGFVLWLWFAVIIPRFPKTAWFILGMIDGLTGGCRRRW